MSRIPVCPSRPATAVAAACFSGLASTLPLTALGQTTAAPVVALPTVEVIAPSPLPGLGVDRNVLPYATQVLRRGAIDAAQPENLSELMLHRLGGVQINEIQGSPFQADLTFRGYRASGLVGAAQGLSVYLDGIRVNEPFGDIVSWDLIPESAIDAVALTPGGNPTFGLNTLGGAISLTTTDGRRSPGLRASVTLGSFGRRKLEASIGGASEGWDHYVSLGGFTESGWRDESPGRVGHLMAKVGLDRGTSRFTVTALIGRSRLVGNGLVPESRLDDDGARSPDLGASRYTAVYTHPDQTRQALRQVSVGWRHALSPTMTAESLIYLRTTRRDTVNGDTADEAVLDGDDAAAALNRTTTRQRAIGWSGALAADQGVHRWQVGASLDRARVRFVQTEQEGDFDASRGVTGRADEPIEFAASVVGSSHHLAFYATDTWRLRPGLNLTMSLRHNRSRLSNQLTSVDDDSDEVSAKPEESFDYRSTNPAVGLAWQWSPAAIVFANVARNTRVPTVIELGCADPDEPCRLPAGLQSDPFLRQVVARSVEVGTRVVPAPGWRGSASVYRSDNTDDIVFRSVGPAGQRGYFQNFERTRHIGLDLDLGGRAGPFDLNVSYSFLRATYEASGLLRFGERNVTISPGTPIAGLPRHSAKLAADWREGSGFTLGLDVQAFSSRGVAGNEDGLIEDDEDERVSLRLPRYAVAHLRLRWQSPTRPGVELFGRIGNLFDRRYATYGALAETRFTPTGEPAAEPSAALFTAPGAPRSLTIGARLAF
jgi:outer membrane cobalamin receptor